MNRLLLFVKRTFRGFKCFCGQWHDYVEIEENMITCENCGRREVYYVPPPRERRVPLLLRIMH